MKIEKRDGKLVDFDSNKIKEAIKKASKSSSEKLSDEDIEKVVSFVEKSLGDADSSVEEIQEFVEDGLMHDNHYETAKTYIKYREERTAERFKRLEITKEIKEKLDASNIQNQNANVDESSFGGRKGEADSALMKQMALDYYISPKFTKNHKDNRVYIHDLDSYVLGDHNCLSIPFDHLLSEGFQTRQTDVRPANSVNTAMQLIAVIFQIQSLQQFGGVSATHLDWTMVPYVRKSFLKHFKDGLKYVEGLSEEEIKKIID